MSQCHDHYEPSERPPASVGVTEAAVAVAVTGVPCHDAYPVEGWSAPADRHPCRLAAERQDGVSVVRAAGRVDWATQAAFQDLLGAAGTGDVVIDLSDATTDSAGTGTLLAAAARAGVRRQRLVVVTPDPLEQEVLAATHLPEVVPVVDSLDEALRWFADHPVAPALPG